MLKRIIAIVAGLAIVITIFLGGRYIHGLMTYRRIISEIEISTPDLSHIQDGTFNGSFDAIFVSADVNVTIENHRITEIIINEHYNDRGEDAEIVIEDVILSQSLEVDTVSGATNSSKVILSAIENALESAVQQP